MRVQDESTDATPILPPGVWLLPGERLIRVVPYPFRAPKAKPSSLREMTRLARVKEPHDIGKRGPTLASLALQKADGAIGQLERSQSDEHLHLYEAVFGRDALRTAIDLVASYPALARSTLVALARLQGLRYHRQREEEPGRIVHEARDAATDLIAQRLTAERGWQWPYYGSVDATPEFIRTMAAYCRASKEGIAFLSQRYTDRQATERTMQQALDMAVQWIERRLAANRDGLVEFQRQLPRGIENQVWKDSWDAYHHADGRIANHQAGIASIEVQVAAYDALLDAAELYQELATYPIRRIAKLRQQAERLRRTILAYFWTEDKGGYFVLGTDRAPDGTVRQLKIRTSNMGHVLNSRLLDIDEPEAVRMRQSVVGQLTSPGLLAPAGIRTLAKDERRFRPGAYHNGSVWPWDSHHIAKGLRRHGYTSIADDLDNRLLSIVEATGMFPEYVRGDDNPVPHVNSATIDVWDEQQQRPNRIEQPPQQIQAWTAAAVLATRQRRNRHSLGLDLVV